MSQHFADGDLWTKWIEFHFVMFFDQNASIFQLFAFIHNLDWIPFCILFLLDNQWIEAFGTLTNATLIFSQELIIVTRIHFNSSRVAIVSVSFQFL